ncbi:hypothetical protein OAA83_02975 [Candidatus Marinimicrobia bacterium]|jgi:hypothetical protein|nr:hypothetical protein [Candidatus Neomarinimicrobiota bacterium]MDB9884717.1 hypothetical protein [Candidatus Neomarinimicrobiota bacterium]|tara:strand:+ start:19 stop:687 length:669 start_codon:yes stop_codon:yes gene_type:complete
MKKILARGGIEFIAVLLGISGSLWIDNNKDTKEVNYQIERSLHALKETLKSDSKTLEKYILNFENKIVHFEYIQNNDSVMFSSDEKLRIAFENTTTNAGIRLDNTIFNSLESLGLIYKINNDSLRNGILNLYQKRYVFLKEITDYHLHTIQQMDEVILDNFIMSKTTRMWNLDYSDNTTRRNIINNQKFQNYLAANKSTHSILEFLCKNILNDVKDLIDLIK